MAKRNRPSRRDLQKQRAFETILNNSYNAKELFDNLEKESSKSAMAAKAAKAAKYAQKHHISLDDEE